MAPSKLPTKRIKACGEALTSAEFMEKMKEIEKAKQDKAKEKEEKKLQHSQRAVKNTKKKGMLYNDAFLAMTSCYNVFQKVQQKASNLVSICASCARNQFI